MKVLLLGKSGMLGSRLLEELQSYKEIQLEALSRADLDVTDYNKLKEVLEKSKPNILINCTAYTDVDGAESNQQLAFKINGEFLETIAKHCRKLDIVLIHFSTDYVFDGESKNGYEEDASANPANIYGKSKWFGEKAIKENMEKYYIVRTSWLYGENGKNFVTTMLKLAESKTELDIVDDQVGAPTYTKDLAKAVIENFLNKRLEFGIYHIINDKHTTWYGFASEVFKLARIPMKLNPISTEKLNRPAPRPKCSILLNNKLEKLRPWQEALADFISHLVLPKAQ